jgi:HK97 family phage major capsid protein
MNQVKKLNIEGGDNLAAKKPYRFLGEQLIDIAHAGRTDRPGCALARERLDVTQRAISGMSTSVPSDGGYFLRPDFSTGLLDKPEEVSEISSRCFKIPIGQGFDSVSVPFFDETSRATGSRFGGVQVYRSGESIPPTATHPKLGAWEARLFDLKALCYATKNLLRDATALERVVTKSFRSETFFKLDDEIIRGTGVGQCLGITVAPALVTIDKEPGQLPGTIVTENINNIFKALFASSRKTAAWFYNEELEPDLETLTVAIGDGGTRMPLFVPAGMGNNNTNTAKLKGLPAIPVEQCSAPGALGDLILADLSGYILIDQGDIDIQSSIHVKFIERETVFRFVYPVNGAPWLRQPVVPYKGSVSKSHLVALEER